MFTVQDVIHIIQYYYHTSNWEEVAPNVEQLRLTSIRGRSNSYILVTCADLQILRKQSKSLHHPYSPSTPYVHSTMPAYT
jgi:hypothetical protein